MIRSFQTSIFNLYEQPHIRNWFYTLAFAIFVPTGFRFAILSWEYGDWFDKPLAVIAGAFIGATAGVTLLRVWKVPPRRTVSSENDEVTESQAAAAGPNASEMFASAKGLAALNRKIARGAAALGSSREGSFWR
jgi:hypothetical protein